MDYHIIGDIHGQADKLESLLRRLGYRQEKGVYSRSNAKIVFLGDFIDRGPHQRRVIDIVRPMVESGNALAVMGNHEFNAIAYHSLHPDTADPLRPHNEQNTRQHQAFLDEYRLHEEETRKVIGWFKTLPVYQEIKDETGRVLFRAVHACWSPPIIKRVPQILNDGYLVDAAIKGTQAYSDIEVLLKGPEIPLPNGVSFLDKDGNQRHSIRIKWWNTVADINYRNLAMVPREEEGKLPVSPVAGSEIADYHYDSIEPPIFFGHYWLTGKPGPIAENLACLDYSAGKGGVLVAYHWKGKDNGALLPERFVVSALALV